jgi:[ribosomal protein S5]-alanine N-acetyltransferase
MILPINITLGEVEICALRAEDLAHFDKMATDVYDILSDENTLQFIPEKRLRNIEEAEKWLQSSVINFHAERNYIHLIRSRVTGSIIGMIDILSPKLVRDHYLLLEYPYFIEFYLKKDVQNSSLMTWLLPCVVKVMKDQGIDKLSAVTDKRNHPAKRVLEKSGFIYRAKFDVLKDLYETLVSPGEALWGNQLRQLLTA